jgi:CBS-domain-containing membrane protein
VRYQQAAQSHRKMLHASVDCGPILHVDPPIIREVLTLRPEDTVESAWNIPAAGGLVQAPVLDKGLRPVEQVPTLELLTAIHLEDGQVRDSLSRSVVDVTITPVVRTDPVTKVRRVAPMLLDQHLHGMPVVSERHELAGSLTRSDILRALVNDPPRSL